MSELKTFEVRVQGYSDSELIAQTQRLFLKEKQLGDAILLGLREIKARRLYASLGFASLFEMLVKYFGLSESSAYVRLSALRLMEAVPEAQSEIFTGRLSLSNAAQVQSFIQRTERESVAPMPIEKKKEVIAAVCGKSHKQAQATLMAMNPIAALPVDREKPLTQNHSQMQITVDQETLQLLKEARELLSHQVPDGNLNEVLKLLAKTAVPVLRKARGRELPKTMPPERSTSDANKPRVNSRSISREVKRAIFVRSKGQCEYIGPNGRRCESRHQLEIDHIRKWSWGGRTEFTNLRHLCRVHNQFREFVGISRLRPKSDLPLSINNSRSEVPQI